MLHSNLLQLLQCLDTDNYKTSIELSDILMMSDRTVRTRLKELDDILRRHGAVIETKTRYGSKLTVLDRGAYELFLKEHVPEKEEDSIPDTVEERVNFLLFYLLNQKDYVKMDDLAEFLYISRGSLASALKNVEAIYTQYRIRILRKSNYGILAVGNEMDVRRCIGDAIIKKSAFQKLNGGRQEKELKELAEMILPCMHKYKISFSETAFEHFVQHIYVERRRIAADRVIDLRRDEISNLSPKEWAFVEDLAAGLSEKYHIVFPESEKLYLGLHLAGKRMLGTGEQDEENFVVRSELDQLVVRMLETVRQEFHVDLRNAFDLRMCLNQHMVPFDIRMRFNLPAENPILKHIKENYMMGYRMAAVASTVLAEYYGREIPEDEVGFFALLFALALEKKKTSAERRDILIVCGSGKGSSRLLKFRYEQEFGQYLNHIYICDVFELERFDFSKVDYVFTTVSIAVHVPVPILEVNLFLQDAEIKHIRKLLQTGKTDFMEKYYQESTFLTDITGETKEEILKTMCGIVVKERPVPEDYYHMVMQREELGTTDYGNLVAIPHALECVTEESFVYVAVLKHPVIWNRYPVQVVLLTAVGREEDPDIQRFYELTTGLIVNQAAIKELIEVPEHTTLMRLFKQCESG